MIAAIRAEALVPTGRSDYRERHEISEGWGLSLRGVRRRRSVERAVFIGGYGACPDVVDGVCSFAVGGCPAHAPRSLESPSTRRPNVACACTASPSSIRIVDSARSMQTRSSLSHTCSTWTSSICPLDATETVTTASSGACEECWLTMRCQHIPITPDDRISPRIRDARTAAGIGGTVGSVCIERVGADGRRTAGLAAHAVMWLAASSAAMLLVVRTNSFLMIVSSPIGVTKKCR